MPVTIQLSESGESRVVDAGTPVRDVLPARSPEGLPYLGAIAGGEIVSLNTPLAVGGRVRGLTAADDDGWAILRRSMCLLLAMAARRALPDRLLRVRHSLGCGVWATLRDGDVKAISVPSIAPSNLMSNPFLSLTVDMIWMSF